MLVFLETFWSYIEAVLINFFSDSASKKQFFKTLPGVQVFNLIYGSDKKEVSDGKDSSTDIVEMNIFSAFKK